MHFVIQIKHNLYSSSTYSLNTFDLKYWFDYAIKYSETIWQASSSQQGSNKKIERPLFPGLYLTIVYNSKIKTIPNNSLNPAHPIAVVQAKPQP